MALPYRCLQPPGTCTSDVRDGAGVHVAPCHARLRARKVCGPALLLGETEQILELVRFVHEAIYRPCSPISSRNSRLYRAPSGRAASGHGPLSSGSIMLARFGRRQLAARRTRLKSVRAEQDRRGSGSPFRSGRSLPELALCLAVAQLPGSRLALIAPPHARRFLLAVGQAQFVVFKPAYLVA